MGQLRPQQGPVEASRIRRVVGERERRSTGKDVHPAWLGKVGGSLDDGRGRRTGDREDKLAVEHPGSSKLWWLGGADIHRDGPEIIIRIGIGGVCTCDGLIDQNSRRVWLRCQRQLRSNTTGKISSLPNHIESVAIDRALGGAG